MKLVHLLTGLQFACLVSPASAGQYVKQRIAELGLHYATAVSFDGSVVVGRADWQDSFGRAAYWRRGVGVSYVDLPNGGFLGGWLGHVTLSNEVFFTHDSLSGVPGLWRYGLETNDYMRLPSADYSGHYGTPVDYRIKDSNGAGSLLGYTEFDQGIGPTVNAPTVWHRIGGVWTARWIRDTSTFVYSLDEAGNVFGQNSAGQASIWDMNLVRTDLVTPTGFIFGKAHGRLRDGRILGQLYTGSTWHIAIWANETATPTTTYFGNRGQIEAPALGALDTLFLAEEGAPRKAYTWTPSEGKLSVESQVLGGLPSGHQGAMFVGDGGHLILNSLDDGNQYLLTPVPEPTTALLALPTLLLMRRKRLRIDEPM